MIVISIGAGLGNQMFEYAFYIQLREIYKEQQIKMDIQYAFPKAHNGIEIFRIFDLPENFADFKEIKKLIGWYPMYCNRFFLKKLVNKILGRDNIKPKTLLVQNDFTKFYDKFFNIDLSKSYYFYGAFANYQYFEKCEKKIKNIFKFPKLNDQKNLAYKKQIEECNSVSIHIRRGDYIKLGIQTIDIGFYKQAIDIIENKVTNPIFFIFTDDIEFSKKLFGVSDNFVYIEGNTGVESYKDMQLMSICKHNIIANSTFSFWGAFLNQNQNKIVISPNLSFTGCEYPFTCPGWILL